MRLKETVRKIPEIYMKA